jgi:hypothetical protein
MTAPRTFDIRVWIEGEDAWPAAHRFLVDVQELAKKHHSVQVRWVCERRDRQGRPRIRIHQPPRLDHDAGTDRQEGERP